MNTKQVINKKSMEHLFSKTKIHYQLPVEELVKQTIARDEGILSDTGALVISTGKFTGRSPLDKFIVKDKVTDVTIDWNKFNQPIDEGSFLSLRNEMIIYLDNKDEIWMRDICVCADDQYLLSARVVNEFPSGNHFAANMFISRTDELPEVAKWFILQAPGFQGDVKRYPIRQSNFTIISFTHRTILIGGSGYTGEIKKGMFTVLNFILPHQHRVLSMHCSANEGLNGDTALFFGLSGTGKTTLSSDPARKLIGDDEHGWDEKGIFNFEGGCYAKIVNLSATHEPAIFNALKPGALIENVSFLPGSGIIDFAATTITENTRVSYPLSFIANSKNHAAGKTPENIFFLTCDACGVLPPISKLTTEQAMYYFINGYTAKVAGTETGVIEPQITFSPCFAAPFIPLNPHYYAALLKHKLDTTGAKVWMINTGWTGGGYGIGKRISLIYTRAMISAVLTNALTDLSYEMDAVFGLMVPVKCPGVPTDLLLPVKNWENENDYFEQAKLLLKKFEENYSRFSFTNVLNAEI